MKSGKFIMGSGLLKKAGTAVLLAGWFCGSFLGCAGMSDKKDQRRVMPGPVAAGNSIDQQLQAPAEGSLWSDSGGLSQMFINAKARHVGDILTVNIVETSSASNKATTKTGRTSSLTGGLSHFFNMEQSYPSDRPFFNPFSSVSGSLSSDFNGDGSTVRSGALTAYMTARIVEILPNGNLLIEGNREVRVNDENQIITLTGLVRPRDVSADNVVQSTYIADAKISYSGTGIVNDRQKPGWLMRILDYVWPF
jgi:flagellar L-ring protein precursor FlgH